MGFGISVANMGGRSPRRCSQGLGIGGEGTSPFTAVGVGTFVVLCAWRSHFLSTPPSPEQNFFRRSVQ